MNIYEQQENFIRKIKEYKNNLSVNRKILFDELEKIEEELRIHVNGLVKYNNLCPLDEMEPEFFESLREFGQIIK